MIHDSSVVVEPSDSRHGSSLSVSCVAALPSVGRRRDDERRHARPLPSRHRSIGSRGRARCPGRGAL
ncbi:Hypothetical protein A7982_05457 [Minicystis rosea]|nr:Hypothetical protein A7982_05457 [Minicystis rosea]